MKTILVVGGSKGIGGAIADRLRNTNSVLNVA